MKIILVAYDNDSHISYFPLGLAYIASAARNAGHQVKIWNQDVYHWPDSKLTEILNDEHFDVVGIGVIGGYYQYRRLLGLSKAINASEQKPFFVLGGHGPSPEPEYFLRKTGADAVVIGEGERTFVELLDALENKKGLQSVSGIAYLDADEFHKTSPRPLIADIDSISLPAWDMFPMEHYVLKRRPRIENRDRLMSIASGRGCLFHCNFCYRMDKGLRIRSAENIVEEMLVLRRNYRVNYFDFCDELTMNSIERVEKLCEYFLREVPGVRWSCNGRLNFAKLPVLKLMRRAGCVFIDYGIESVDDMALRNMHKSLTVRQIVTGIENTLAANISPGFNIIFGNIGETAEILQKDVDFLLKYDDHSQLRTIRPVTPYPGSPLYYYAIQKGLLEGPEDFYERKHVNSDLLSVNFTELSDDEFHQRLFEANKTLIAKYHEDQCAKATEGARKLYREKNLSFRGFRQV